MNVPVAFAVGAATHTGWVRANNEDDFLVASAPAPAKPLLVCAVADGLGGAAGGAEASRLGLRALGATVLDAAATERLPQRIAAGFAAAAARVFEESGTVPALRGMGTTLSALCLEDGVGRVGHVGDTRIYRLRDGVCEQLTQDHAVREPDNLLTRCVGGGHATCEADQFDVALRAGDRFLLTSDGVWAALPVPTLGRLLARGDPQAVAEALVGASLQAGGNDNATAVVVDVLAVTASDQSRSVELPRDERPAMRNLWPRAHSLRVSVWPAVLWAAAVVVGGAFVLRWSTGIDLWATAAAMLPR